MNIYVIIDSKSYVFTSVGDPYVLDLPDPHPDPLVTSKDLAPDPFSSSKNRQKNLDFYCFVTSFRLFIFEE
jgi:hypothetical protein